MNHPRQFTELVDRLITDAKKLLRTSREGMISDRQTLKRWSNELILLHKVGGKVIAPWRQRLGHSGTLLVRDSVEGPLAALETIKFAVDNGLLNSYRELVIAEAFAGLFEQGRHLLEQGYFLAAGVVFRSVLEEKLRDLCVEEQCTPQKDRPTINDLNQALYKCDAISYDKAMMLHVTALAAIGNNAAHNDRSLKQEDVVRLQHGTLEFLSRYAPR